MAQFNYPSPWGGYFNVYNSWLEFSEINKFNKTINFYCPRENNYELIKINNIKPPKRNKGIQGLTKCRTVSLLCAILHNEELPLIEVTKCENENYYILTHGFHRYHASLIAGFTEIPSVIIKN